MVNNGQVKWFMMGNDNSHLLTKSILGVPFYRDHHLQRGQGELRCDGGTEAREER